MALLPDLRLFVPEVVGLNAVIIVLLSLAPILHQRIKIDWSIGSILFVSAIVRGMFLFHSPELSDDLFRYLFDGLMFLDGHSPYAAPPTAIRSDNPAMVWLVSRINHADLFTIYPPAAQLLFAVGAFIGGVAGIKTCLVTLDLISCFVILRILEKIGLPRANAVLYAWHPLPVLEIAVSGHIDAAAISLSLLTFLLLLCDETSIRADRVPSQKNGCAIFLPPWPWLPGCVAGSVFSLAVLTKWIPLIFLPGILLLTHSGNRKSVVLGFLFSSTALFLFFWPEVQTSFHTLGIYAANWEFSGFFFRWLREATGSGGTARLAIVIVFVAVTAAIYGRFHKTCHLFPTVRTQGIFACLYLTAMAFLLLTPTLHPWYGLYLVAFLPFAAGPSGIIFSWSIFFTYRVVMLYGLTGQWIEDDLIPFFVVMAPASAMFIGTVFRVAKQRSRESDQVFHGSIL